MKIAYLFGYGCVRMFLKIISEIDHTGKGFIIFFRDAHACIVKIAAAKKNVDLVLVQPVELVADQGVAELDHGERVKLGMICVFGKR